MALAAGNIGLTATAASAADSTAAADLTVTSPVLTATVSATGGIRTLTFADGRRWAMDGRSLVGDGTALARANRCVPDGDAHSTPGGGATWQTKCTDSRGRTTLLTETLAPADTGISWTLSAVAALGTYSKGIWTKLSGWHDSHTRLFWTTWSDSGVQGATGWSNPLSPAPFANRALGYGTLEWEQYPTSAFAVPLASIIEPDTDHALSLVQSPGDVLLTAAIQTTAGGDVAFGRFYNRLTADKAVTFHMSLVPTEADWRPALGWVTRHYPGYFTPVVGSPDTEGLGSYSPYPGPFTATLRAKLAAEDLRTNWELSLRGPYQGEFLPPVSSANEQWEPDLGTFRPQTPKSWSLNRWRHVLGYWDDAGLTSFAYFNASLFGHAIRYPAPPHQYSCSDPNRWKSANDYLYCDFPNAIVRGADGTPVFDWRTGVVMDPGDPAYGRHLVEQAQALLTQLPSYAGLIVDQMEHFDIPNVHADDGITWYDGRPARSLVTSWKQLAPSLEAVVHRLGKQIWGNSYSNPRIDPFEGLDGVFSENSASSTTLNLDGFLGLQRPVIEWVSSLGANPDAVLQRCLYMGVFPMADAPANDHGTGTSPSIAHSYAAYGPMFKALTGKQWVYTPHAVAVTSGTAVANVFSVNSGVVVPVIEGGTASSVGLALRDLARVSPGLDQSHAQILLPGQSTWQPLPVSKHGSVVTLTVPLSRGAAMVRFASTHPAEDLQASRHPVALILSPSSISVSSSKPATLSATLRNRTEHTISDVSASIDVPGGWTAQPMDTAPRDLPHGASATVHWKLTSTRDIAGTVGEIRVRVQYGVGARSGQASDAVRLTAGALLAQDAVTATATSEQPGHPAQAAVDGDDASFWLSDTAADQPAVITLNLHGAYRLAGLTYLPRQDGDVAGWIGDYGVLVSSDGVTYTQVSRGSWGFDAGLQAATFDATNVHYVRLVNESSHVCLTPTRSQAMSAAEINLVLAPPGESPLSPRTAPSATPRAAPPFDHMVPHSGMTAIATSEQSTYPSGNAIDANACTVWQTQWAPWPAPPRPMPPLDQSITLDLGKTYDTTGMAYLPQLNNDGWGEIMKYEVAVSLDDRRFSVVARGTWEPTQVEKYVQWSPTAARFVRLKALTSSGYGISAAAADLEVGYR